jgi:hypothetical protein
MMTASTEPECDPIQLLKRSGDWSPLSLVAKQELKHDDFPSPLAAKGAD